MSQWRKLALAGLSFLFTYSILTQFMASTTMSNAMPLTLFIALGTVILTFVNRYRFSIPLLALALLFCLYQYFGEGLSITAWLAVFTREITEATSLLLSRNASYFPNSLGFTLIGVFFASLLIMLIRLKHWKTPFILGLIYTFVLIALNLSTSLRPILTLLITNFLIAGLVQPKRSLPSLVIPILVVALISANIPTALPMLQHSIESSTIDLRNSLANALFKKLQEIGSSTGITLSTGFSENDTQLGGPINEDNTTVFTAQQTEPHYWRIEAKEYLQRMGYELLP